MKQLIGVALSSAVLLVACGTAPADNPPDTSSGSDTRPAARSMETCDATALAGLVGQPAEVAETIPEPRRIIPPGSAVTMDLRMDRTNVDLDADGRITRIWCG